MDKKGKWQYFKDYYFRYLLFKIKHFLSLDQEKAHRLIPALLLLPFPDQVLQLGCKIKARKETLWKEKQY